VNFFEARAASVDLKLGDLAGRLKSHLGVDEQRVLKNDTCIYTVGSGGRGEMSEHRDVDLFVARVHRAPSEVDAFQIRQAITRALFEMGFPEPSQGGGFLKMHTGESLCERMGTRDDDASNSLTARMLLLLESRVLLGENAHGNLVDSVLEGRQRPRHRLPTLRACERYRSLLADSAAELRRQECREGEGARSPEP